MRSFDTTINYDGNPVTLHIDSAFDVDLIHSAVGATIAMALKLDIDYRRKGVLAQGEAAEYRVIQAHGENYVLQQQGADLMTKDAAADIYDVINACNNELWQPKEGSKVKAYALGIINSMDVHRGESMNTINFKAHFNGTPKGVQEQNPDGLRFIIDGQPYSALNISGKCYHVLDTRWNFDGGLDKLIMKDTYDCSTRAE